MSFNQVEELFSELLEMFLLLLHVTFKCLGTQTELLMLNHLCLRGRGKNVFQAALALASDLLLFKLSFDCVSLGGGISPRCCCLLHVP